MKNIVSFLLLVLAASTVFPSCKKGSAPLVTPKPPVQTQVGPYLYVGGSNGVNGIYWKISLTNTASDAVQDTFPNSKNIISIITQDSDTYITGGAGGYWKNDTFVAVTGASSIDYLALSGSHVFSLGFDNSSNLAYWDNNNETSIENTLPHESGSLLIKGIAAADLNANTNVYISSSADFAFAPGYVDTLSGNYGLVWKNGNLQVLRAQGALGALIKTGVVISGTDVYVAGQTPIDSAYSYGGGYWKNGVWNSINRFFAPSSIAGSGSNIYIAGVLASSQATLRAAYWENGNLINLPGGIAATAIATDGSGVYILGVDNNGNNVLWKNGSLFKTLGTAAGFGADCLAIGN